MSGKTYVDQMLAAYLECALWSEFDDSGEPLDDRYGALDIADDSVAAMRTECVDFVQRAGALLDGIAADMAGHDFWLTRNSHGAGFWDRGYPGDIGERLSAIAHGFGESNLLIGDDGALHVFPLVASSPTGSEV